MFQHYSLSFIDSLPITIITKKMKFSTSFVLLISEVLSNESGYNFGETTETTSTVGDGFARGKKNKKVENSKLLESLDDSLNTWVDSNFIDGIPLKKKAKYVRKVQKLQMRYKSVLENCEFDKNASKAKDDKTSLKNNKQRIEETTTFQTETTEQKVIAKRDAERANSILKDLSNIFKGLL